MNVLFQDGKIFANLVNVKARPRSTEACLRQLSSGFLPPPLNLGDGKGPRGIQLRQPLLDLFLQVLANRGAAHAVQALTRKRVQQQSTGGRLINATGTKGRKAPLPQLAR